MRSVGLGVLGLLAIAPLIILPADAAETPILGEGSYGQQLEGWLVSAYPDIATITLYVAPPGKPEEVVAASNNVKIGVPASNAVKIVLQTGQPRFVTNAAAHRFDADLVMLDMQHKQAGVISLGLRATSGKGEASLKEEGIAIRDRLARRISYAANLLQAAHMDPNVPLHSYAQHLVDAALVQHPDVLILAIHATTPSNADPEILASNIGRIGKKADEDDMRVVRDGKTNLEVNKGLMRYEVELPLHDVSGVRIGALGVVFSYDAHTDRKARHAEAVRIRDEISRRILKPANLVEPWPYDPHYPDDSYAQHLVDKTLAAHPEVRVLALHVTPPNSKTNIILASNIGRIGKVADSDDMSVVNTGKPDMAVNKEGNRFEAELALKDAAGKQIGAISVVYAYEPGASKVLFQHEAQAIADELARQIPDAAALFNRRR